MRPRDFWACSLIEWVAAVDGYRESIGAEKGSGLAPLTVADVEAMDELYEQQMKGPRK